LRGRAAPTIIRIVRLFVLVAAVGCAGPGLLTDGTSVSVGSHARGLLRRGRRLPPEGEGYRIPGAWKVRQSNYGTDELVGAVVHAARRVARERPGGMLGVADLSLKGGAESSKHRSHLSGRDVDLHFYSTDAKGMPLPPPELYLERYGAGGVGLGASDAPPPGEGAIAGPPRRFDAARNWLLVRALLEDATAEVQWIFVATPLEERLLAYAQAAGEPPALIEQASLVLHQPLDSSGHNDHFHVRLYCAPGDRALGCQDRGPARWRKKLLKYDRPLPMAASRLGATVPLALLRRMGSGVTVQLPF
jgi:penicillin-insensitive murein DD-endopeptidase